MIPFRYDFVPGFFEDPYLLHRLAVTLGHRLLVVGVHGFSILAKTTVVNTGIIFQTDVSASHRIDITPVQFVEASARCWKFEFSFVQGVSDVDSPLFCFPL